MSERIFLRLAYQVSPGSPEHFLLKLFADADPHLKSDLRHRMLAAMVAYLYPDAVRYADGSQQEIESAVRESILRLQSQIAYLSQMAPQVLPQSTVPPYPLTPPNLPTPPTPPMSPIPSTPTPEERRPARSVQEDADGSFDVGPFSNRSV